VRVYTKANFPERLEQARKLLEDGASRMEVTRSTGVTREALVKYCPGMKWTFTQAGQFRALTRDTKVRGGL
jgi:hypothetical protein